MVSSIGIGQKKNIYWTIFSGPEEFFSKHLLHIIPLLWASSSTFFLYLLHLLLILICFIICNISCKFKKSCHIRLLKPLLNNLNWNILLILKKSGHIRLLQSEWGLFRLKGTFSLVIYVSSLLRVNSFGGKIGLGNILKFK